jgi:hypothetical protein
VAATLSPPRNGVSTRCDVKLPDCVYGDRHGSSTRCLIIDVHTAVVLKGCIHIQINSQQLPESTSKWFSPTSYFTCTSESACDVLNKSTTFHRKCASLHHTQAYPGILFGRGLHKEIFSGGGGLNTPTPLGTPLAYRNPYVIRVTLVAGKVFTHSCDTGKLSALIQSW